MSWKKKIGSFGILMLILIVILGAIIYFEVSSVHYGGVQIPGQQTSGGKLGVGMTIEFADGTTRTVDPSQITYTLFPFTVYFQGQPVSKITWHCFVLLDWAGDLTSLELNGPMEVKSNTGVTLRKENMLKTYTSTSPPAKNQWFELWKFTLEAGDIEYSLGSGSFTLTCTVTVNAVARFSTGTESAKSASASGNLPISIEAAGLLALLCETQVQIFK